MKKQNMAVGLADLTNFARLVDAVDSEKAIKFLLYSLVFLLIKLFFLKEKFGKKSLVARCIQGCGDSIIKYGGQI